MNQSAIRVSAVAVVLAFIASAANAATTQTWNLTTGDTTSPYSNSSSYTNANGKMLTLRAFYADNLSNVNQTVGDSVRTSSLRDATKAAALKTSSNGTEAGVASFGGNGVGITNPYDNPKTSSGQESSTGGQHAIDNYDVDSNGNIVKTTSAKHAHDFLLMDFNEVMQIGDFRIGWTAYDNTDIDFFVAPDTLTGPINISGKSINDLINDGWRTVSLTDVSTCAMNANNSTCPTQFSTGSGYEAGMKSRYVIAAGALGGNDDAFKFSQITMSIPSGGSAPLPGTAALLTLGLAGLAWTRRKSAQST